MRTCIIHNKNNSSIPPLTVKYCESFWDRFVGLMFRPTLTPAEGILLDEGSDSRINTAIHMLFMNFDITVIWINSRSEIVDLKIAPRWSLAHFPALPARFILEIHPSRLNDFQVGDILQIENA